MKSVALASACFAVAGAASPCKQPCAVGCTEPSVEGTDWDTLWENYQDQFGKNYDNSVSTDARREIWHQNMLHIMQENDKGLSYSLGVNQFTDLTKDEFESTYLGYKPQNMSNLGTTLGRFHYDGDLLDLPSDWDWSTSSVEVVTPVKNQGSCGSCWTFSTTGALEGALAVGNGWTQTMSEQQVLDCDTSGSGCQGGLPKQALDWEKGMNVCSEDSYPYTGSQGSCNSGGCSAVLTLGSVWGSYSVDADEGSHCAAVIQRPLSVVVDAGGFQSYTSGIISNCGTTTDHAILLVGYGYYKSNPYWKVKNSWGTTWGLDGYGLVGRPSGSGDGTCGIQSGTNGVYVYGPYNPSSQIRGSDGEFIAEPVRGNLV
uniref:Uncharacterized protein n=1 Tax=Noctiluca scintillans TaxID=2966 RepID=A0A7S1ATH4_NOCSC|mmetsp:Transcript_59595/g.158565  ORF Transcript_59595/g.158565 Transcript_59595/m.158565 type:complete len:371 (+) Transcript_59595:75-1187(+)|eukprot:CAMPEP_0194479196 /NCGR_PEP_ID=MMETSP0253-20130528/2386_1 /TAXON_ID=2966 /ORGANISM="Noctiluca scintillans" /LENGTH=370 /DNA_ID=CAMNT_0039318379 /DNA_START=75 /DNA_END=1187 /DNA_ORIENTATION=-